MPVFHMPVQQVEMQITVFIRTFSQVFLDLGPKDI